MADPINPTVPSTPNVAAPVAVATEPIVRFATVNGKSLSFHEAVLTRGDAKGKPTLAPKYKNGKFPDAGELIDWANALGAQALLKGFSRIIRNLVTDAAGEAAVRSEDGKSWALDNGLFVNALLTNVQELDKGVNEVRQQELVAAGKEFNAFFDTVMENYMKKGLAIPDPATKQLALLKLKVASIQESIDKSARKGKKDAAPATPAAK